MLWSFLSVISVTYCGAFHLCALNDMLQGISLIWSQSHVVSPVWSQTRYCREFHQCNFSDMLMLYTIIGSFTSVRIKHVDFHLCDLTVTRYKEFHLCHSNLILKGISPLWSQSHVVRTLRHLTMWSQSHVRNFIYVISITCYGISPVWSLRNHGNTFKEFHQCDPNHNS